MLREKSTLLRHTFLADIGARQRTLTSPRVFQPPMGGRAGAAAASHVSFAEGE